MKSNHQYFERLCSLALNNELSPSEEVEFALHSNECPRCKGQLTQLIQLTEELHRIHSPKPIATPKAMTERFIDRAEKEGISLGRSALVRFTLGGSMRLKICGALLAASVVFAAALPLRRLSESMGTLFTSGGTDALSASVEVHATGFAFAKSVERCLRPSQSIASPPPTLSRRRHRIPSHAAIGTASAQFATFTSIPFNRPFPREFINFSGLKPGEVFRRSSDAADISSHSSFTWDAQLLDSAPKSISRSLDLEAYLARTRSELKIKPPLFYLNANPFNDLQPNREDE